MPERQYQEHLLLVPFGAQPSRTIAQPYQDRMYTFKTNLQLSSNHVLMGRFAGQKHTAFNGGKTQRTDLSSTLLEEASYLVRDRPVRLGGRLPNPEPADVSPKQHVRRERLHGLERPRRGQEPVLLPELSGRATAADAEQHVLPVGIDRQSGHRIRLRPAPLPASRRSDAAARKTLGEDGRRLFLDAGLWRSMLPLLGTVHVFRRSRR